MKTTGRINRTGSVSFGDASLSVWEEGLNQRMTWDERQAWERQFKREVFARIVQTLNRLGWTCVVPQDYVKQYSLSFARDRRECSKGDLKGWLEISGRTIKFETWQGVNTPTRPDHGGRYEWDKEACMPYVLRLEMERTRRRIRDYLCNVFTGYTFDAKSRSIYLKPLQRTAMQHIWRHYAESGHFKGDWPEYLAKNSGMAYNRKSADDMMLSHGQRVWFADRKGRICEGTAYYNINNMWWVVTGRYDYTNKACFDLYAARPENIRVKRNAELRRKRLEGLLAQAAKTMNFERAAVLRDLLFPRGEPLFAVYHEGHKAYHRAGFRGYAADIVDAGKFTSAEVKNWGSSPNKVVPLTA